MNHALSIRIYWHEISVDHREIEKDPTHDVYDFYYFNNAYLMTFSPPMRLSFDCFIKLVTSVFFVDLTQVYTRLNH